MTRIFRPAGADGARSRWHIPATLTSLAFSIAWCASVSTQAPALVEYRRSGSIAGREDARVESVTTWPSTRAPGTTIV